MFRSAYLRLSMWYAIIIMAISLAFSVWVYNEAMGEVRASLSGPYIIRLQQQFGPIPRDTLRATVEQQYADSQGRILFNLIMLNVAMLIVGGVGSYLLARRTMRPIEEALESQNRFTADASHELRTPLSAMKTEIEVALRDKNMRSQEMKELLQSNLEEIDRMSDLTEGLLTLARPGHAPELCVVSADVVVQEVVARLKPLADAKKTVIQKELVALKIMAEPKNLATIVGILFDNAIKYSPDAARITVKTERRDSHGQIIVSDNGPGIAVVDLPHVFERFYRADASRTTQKVAGNGLGLSIAQKLATVQCGTLQVRSKEGEGSTFILSLPIAT